MPEGPEPLPSEGAPAPARTRRSKQRRKRREKNRSRTSAARGRLLLVVIFCALRGVDALCYFGNHGAGSKAALLGGIVTNAAWTTALLAGIWFRQNWCRYVLIFFMGLAVAVALVAIPSMIPDLKGNGILTVLGAGTLIYAGLAWLLVNSADIHRLTSRAKE
jgi:hypothetical protein